MRLQSDRIDVESGSVPTRTLKAVPAWAICSLAANGILLITVVLLLRVFGLSTPNPGKAEAKSSQPLAVSASPELGPRHQLSYEQWLNLLQQEATAIAVAKPARLSVLVGDSLSLWFPTDLLPSDRAWLNQGISGEVSGGLLERLSLFNDTQPETIFVMIGINDLIRGVDDFTLLDNQRQIIHYLQDTHPRSQIVVQSVLPHGSDRATWEGRDRLKAISNQRIRDLNQELKAIAQAEGVYFLDLHPLFTDAQGNLRADFTTDGLHLNRQGYLVWRSALQLFSKLELEPTALR